MAFLAFAFLRLLLPVFEPATGSSESCHQDLSIFAVSSPRGVSRSCPTWQSLSLSSGPPPCLLLAHSQIRPSNFASVGPVLHTVGVLRGRRKVHPSIHSSIHPFIADAWMVSSNKLVAPSPGPGSRDSLGPRWKTEDAPHHRRQGNETLLCDARLKTPRKPRANPDGKRPRTGGR